jgi:hypothetical protein
MVCITLNPHRKIISVTMAGTWNVNQSGRFDKKEKKC